MAMTKCLECYRDISDKAAVCPGCGAPVTVDDAAPRAPDEVSFDGTHFSGTVGLLANLARSAISQLGYRVDAVDQAAGTITFTTGMTMGSWAGVSGTIHMHEVAPFQFNVTGEAKQNLKGGQVVALDLFGEAKGKIDAVVKRMQALAAGQIAGEAVLIDPGQADADSGFILAVVGVVLLLVLIAAFSAG